MKGPGFLRRLGAYRDGALSGPARQRFEQQIEADPESARLLHDMRILSEAVRVTWTDGPPGPDPDRLLASLRPGLRAVDAELGPPSGPALRDRLATLLRPAPARVLAGAALAGLLAVAVLPFVGTGEPRLGSQPSLAATAESWTPDTIYDLDQGDVSVMVFEAEDGATVVWMLDEEPELISRASSARNA